MKFTFVGCSLTVGEGLALEKADRQNYCNRVGEHYIATVTNLGQKGNSNYNIFMSAINEMQTNPSDMMFVQWSGLNRQWLYPGPDTQLVISSNPQTDYLYRDIRLSKSQLQFFADQFQLLNHDFKNILSVINYSNILSRLGKVTFINGLLPWTDDLAKIQSLTNPAECFSGYTKNILDFDTRNDEELTKLFLELYTNIQTLDPTLWVNMFSSMYNSIIDTGTDNCHPGPNSHAQYAEMIIKYLEERK